MSQATEDEKLQQALSYYGVLCEKITDGNREFMKNSLDFLRLSTRTAARAASAVKTCSNFSLNNDIKPGSRIKRKVSPTEEDEMEIV